MLTAALLVASCGISSGSGENDDFPKGPIELVVPYPAGGGTDTVARALAPFLEKELGTSVEVVIRSGGAGTSGALYVLDQPADGQTIMVGESGIMTTGPLANPDAPYDPDKDFRGVAQLTSDPWILAASADSGLETFEELATALKSDPGSIDIGIAGVLSADHYAMLLVQRQFGFPKSSTVAYGGGGPKTQALLSGEVDVIMDSHEGLKAGLSNERAVPLAVLAEEPLDDLSEVPTMPELGYDSVLASIWQGVMVKAGTPDDIVDDISGAVRSAAEDPELGERLEKLGLTPSFVGTQDFNSMIDKERMQAEQMVEKVDTEQLDAG